ncbi:MAG: GDP-mannose 4,6-dehydratase [Rhizobiaceae bacterium]|nr:GDP-mannose 4,6-dehydratase [Rhizobiaceae bacterium]
MADNNIRTDATAPIVAVTGASGFVGTWLMRQLEARAAAGNFKVVPFFAAAGPDGEDRPGSDIRDASAVAGIVEALQPMSIVHLAAIAAPTEVRQNTRHAWDVNFIGTVNLADAILKRSPDTRLIFASSSDVYGESFNAVHGALAEDGALLPISAYGATKAAADMMLGQAAHDGLRSLRFRPFNHTGPGQSAGYVVPAFARQIALIEKGLQEPVMQVGNLDVERDFLDVRDVVRAYADAALSAAPPEAGAVFNLSSGVARRIGTILEMLLSMSTCRIEIEIEVNSTAHRHGEVTSVEGNASKAAGELGWTPAIPFEETIEAVLNDWRQRV